MFGSLSKEAQREMINSISASNTLAHIFGFAGVFRTTHMRKKYFRECFSEEISLQRDNDHNECVYHYVPILDTLKTLLNDEQMLLPKNIGTLQNHNKI